MKYLLSLTVLFFSISFSGYSQFAISIARKDFKTEKPGMAAAWKHVKRGNSYFDEEVKSYPKAIEEYKQACIYNPANPELNYKLGASYFFSDRQSEAAPYFDKAIELKKDVAKDVYYLSGRSLICIGKFQEAIDRFKNYLSAPGRKSKIYLLHAKKYIEECESALVVTKDTVRVEIKNLGANINSNADDYSEILTSGGTKMLFASRRPMTGKKKSNYADKKFDENIFFSDWVSGAWSVSMLFDKNLITKYCETPLYMNKPGTQLYIYTGYVGDGDIMVSDLKRNKWRKPVPVKFNLNTKSPETSFTFSPAGDEIAFVSNRGKKGLGGKDIYFIKMTNKRKWSKPVNAGPAINTRYDEESVRYSAGGDTLWFSSAGHNTIGGFDIFLSTRNSITGSWNPAVNAGYPINSPWDDLFYYPSPARDSSFFFASGRKGGLGGFDIWKGRYLPPLPPPKPIEPPPPVVPAKRDTVVIRDTVVLVKEVQKPVVPEPPREIVLFLTGKVTDSETREPVLARIEVIDLSTDQIITTTASSDVDGTYRTRLPSKKSYMVNLRATGYLSDMKRIVIPNSYQEEFYTLDVGLNKVKVGKKVVLNNILFELGKSVLTAGSYAELNKLVIILQDSPLMKIEISGHTDNTGSPIINAKLSTDRAKAVVDYLVKKGIDIGRLTYKGYGPDQPIADNATAAGKAKNRRVEFKILGL